MRTWITLGALVGVACHSTVVVPEPQITPDSTVIFFQPTLEHATWTSVDENGKFAAPEQLLDPDEPWHLLTYECSADVLDLPDTLKVQTNLENRPMLPNRLSTLTPDGFWKDVPAPYEALAEDIENLNWIAPEVCNARVGDVSYRLPPIPPNTLDDLTAFFSLGEGQGVFVAANGGAAYTIDKDARVTKVRVPGIVATGYLGADDGQFYLLTRSGEVFRSDLNFETTRIAGGAKLVPPNGFVGSYENNQLFGSPDGSELMVITSSGAYVYEGEDEWTQIRTTTIATLIDAAWISPGQFLVFGGESEFRQDRIHLMRRDGTFVRTWNMMGTPIRFSRLGERIFVSAGRGGVYEFVNGDWQFAYDEGRVSVPIREASTGGIIVATITINFLSTSQFGVYHSQFDRVCLETNDDAIIDGALMEVAPLAPGIDAFVSIRLRQSGPQAPVVKIRTQNVPPSACGYEPAD